MLETSFNAIVLAGGRASRLGGIDKTALEFGGMPLLELALRSVTGARQVVVVGPAALRPRLPEGVLLRTEHPAFGGPAAAIAAGLAALEPAEKTAVVSADVPHAVAAMRELFGVGRLAGRTDGVIAADERGIPQPLLAVYDTAALSRAVRLAGPLTGSSVRGIIAPLVLCRVHLSDELCADVDTPEAALRHGIAIDRVLSHA